MVPVVDFLLSFQIGIEMRSALPTRAVRRLLSTASPLPPRKPSSISVKAYFVARGIDIVKVLSAAYPSYKQEFQTKSITITVDPTLNQYVSIFKYGSVVFFNIDDVTQQEHLKKIKDSSVVAPIDPSLQHTDEYRLLIHDELDKPSIIKATHTNIRSLDSNNVTIVSTVMAQTVALDYYAVVVDKMLENFMAINQKIENKGNFNALDQKGLYKLIANNNTVVTNVLSKLGIFEGTDAAWDNADYHYTWEGLRKDFELDYRFKDLSLKLDIIKENTMFFLEVLKNEKSTKLEWTIIILIATEIVIGIAGLAYT
jgi:uncharacterized Rmd1/YagE family protein